MACIGEVYKFQWDTQDFLDDTGNDLGYHLRLELSRDNGVTRETIAASVLAALGYYNWTVIGAETTQAIAYLTVIETDIEIAPIAGTVFTISSYNATITTPAHRTYSVAGSASKIEIAIKCQDPYERKDYLVDWSQAIVTDQIKTSTWILIDGMNIEGAGNTTTKTRVWLSSGIVGTRYPVTNRIETVAGRIIDFTFTIAILAV